jgi:hypothetical protein
MSNHAITQRSACRFCGSKDVRRFLHFPDIPFFDEVIPAERLGQEFLATMDVFWCADCRSVQSQHDVNASSYYTDYQYVASDSAFIREFMQRLASEAFSRFAMQPGDHVIEVGSADGYQLACFQQLGAKGLGFEAAENLCALSRQRGVAVTTELFTGESLHRIPQEFIPAQAFILLHTFDHLLDPIPFLDTLRSVLDPVRGILILEVHDLAEIICRRETSLFGHEHVSFLHLASMQRLLESRGFVLLDANFIPEEMRRGNSMLIAAGLKGCRHQPRVEIRAADYAWLDDWATYQRFEKVVQDAFRKLRETIRGKVAAGAKIAGYGAWGRGVTTLAMAELTAADLIYVCDRNPFLHGKFTPGSRIPIASPDRILADMPDEVIVFNYGYIAEIRKQLASYTDAGGRLISVLELLGGEKRGTAAIQK